MEGRSVSRWMFLLCLFLQLSSKLIQCSVTYDRKAIVINGQRRILISGSIHYPRSTPEMWEDLIQKAKEGGLDVIETYVFWNVHEPSPGNYNFEGRYDLVRFLKTVQKAGLYAHLRIGPYVCAEWNFGGFPVWLKYVPGISFRTDNEPFKRAMKGFTEKIVNLMKSQRMFESQGGPIILSQIENEYGPQGKALGAAGHDYMTWAANLAVGLGTGVPWVMCKEEDAPDPVINTCNGFYCDAFSPNRPYKPTIWTEAWSGWFTEFGGPIHQRPVQDLAFAVARFIQKGGSFFNYYMYHGGTNFGRSAGGPFITTSYDYDAPLDEYVAADPIVTSLGSLQQAHVYTSKTGDCAAFLSNYDTKSAVGVQTSKMDMLPSNADMFSWETYNEDLTSLDDSSTFTTSGLLEQINVTRDTSDYLWYITSVDISSSESFLHGGELPSLMVQSTGHALHVFINGQLSGSAFGTRENRRFLFTGKVNLHAGTNRIALLSVAVGLPNIGGHFETWKTGVSGPVALHGLDQGKWDLSWKKWTYQVGLKGEAMNLVSLNGISSVDWMQVWGKVKSGLMVRALVDIGQHMPLVTATVAVTLECSGLQNVKLAVANQPSDGNPLIQDEISFAIHVNYITGIYNDVANVHMYHVPRSWLKPTQNLLVLFEELGGDPTRITLVKRSVASVCADVTEYHPNIKNWHIESYGKTQEFHSPKVHLRCSPGQSISSIKFASFGTPLGTCGSFQQGTCHAPSSYAILEKKCIGQPRCSVTIANSNFGKDPCPNVLKRLTVEAVCAPSTQPNSRG
ncbi:hypothetical protein LguiA_005766 [Lonicera macranthoides]